MRALALLVLLLIQEPDIDALLKRLADESVAVRESATTALIAMGEKAELKLKERLSAATGELKVRCQEILDAIEKARKRKAVIPPIRRATLEAKDEPVGEVLEKLRKQTGLPLDPASAPEATRVSVSITDALPLQALDAVCAAADLDYIPYSNMGGWERGKGKEGMIQLRPGHSGTPRAFAGPFVISAPTLSVSKWQSLDKGGKLTTTAYLNFTLFWAPDCRPTRLEKWEILSALDDKGNQLRRDHRLHGHEGLSRNWIEDLQVYLDGPGEGAEKLASVKARGSVLFASEKAVLEFRSPDSCVGETRNQGGVTAKLHQFERTGTGVRVRLHVLQDKDPFQQEEPGRGLARFRHFDTENLRLILEDGRTATRSGTNTSGSPPKGMMLDASFRDVKSKVVAIEISVDTSYVREEFEFELKDLRFPK